ncbi:MAG: hypothetical protein IPG16_02250 [Comamonadaceae bacterium]|nr:hypothetical protein [Comamonadaceae bacterium]
MAHVVQEVIDQARKSHEPLQKGGYRENTGGLVDIGGSDRKPLKTKRFKSTKIHQLRENRLNFGGLKNRHLFTLVDVSFSLVDAFIFSFSLIIKGKKEKEGPKTAKRPVEENRHLVEE